MSQFEESHFEYQLVGGRIAWGKKSGSKSKGYGRWSHASGQKVKKEKPEVKRLKILTPSEVFAKLTAGKQKQDEKAE